MARLHDEKLVRDVGARVRRIRTERGLSIEQLAARVGVEPVTLVRWEAGQRAPSLSVLALVARGLAIPLRELVDVGADVPPPDVPPDVAEVLAVLGSLSEGDRALVLALVRDVGHYRAV